MCKHAFSYSISLGRLYQGKYVPPDRVDGLLSLKEGEEDEEEGDEGERTTGEMEDTAPAQDLDLDWEGWESVDYYDGQTYFIRVEWYQ